MMENRIKEVAERIRALREIMELSREEMAACTDTSVEQYTALEEGCADFSFTFIYKCANRFGVDVTDLLKGSSPTLTSMSVVRAGEGLPIARRSGFSYHNLSPMLRDKMAEPFLVRAPFSAEDQDKPIKLSTHAGQEIDIVVSGALKVQIGDHTAVLHAGDTVHYDSSTPHGMIAAEGEDCTFYAIVLGAEARDYREPEEDTYNAPVPRGGRRVGDSPVAAPFVTTTVDENGVVNSIKFRDTERYNFAYDCVDALAARCPGKLAMLHLDKNKVERRFTFEDMRRESNRTANYFSSLGIKRGDRVLLVLKRHYQFWLSLLALHKLGAVGIPATNQLQKKDYVYRFNAAGVSAVLATADDGVPNHIEDALPESPTVVTKVLVGGSREGWHDFDAELPRYSGSLERVDVGGDDPAIMFFTSGTTGYPKIAVHAHKYALGHYLTARYWHNVNPDGLHFTISDTGWGKALWGKFYGQWLCETAVFTYDFDRFNAADILPLFAKYHITTFCAPPTMYRFFIKESLDKYDLSSLEHATIAGEALNPEVYEQFKKATGLCLMEGFGQTETTLAIANFVGMTPKPGSMGKPSPLYDVDIVDPDGKPVGVGETGEIVIHTDKEVPCGLYLGYYNDEVHTKESWHDGMYHTGDTAWRDEDGYFHYVGRTDDLIKSSGYRIGPFEIESVIMELPYVLECAVTAAPDPIRGQVVKASIVLVKGTEGSDALKKEIQVYVKEHTAPYKYPRIVEFLDELPKTISGKIRRVELRGEKK